MLSFTIRNEVSMLKKKKNKHLTQEEKWHIYMLKGSVNSVRNIAKNLNQDLSVISREIKQNSIQQSQGSHLIYLEIL